MQNKLFIFDIDGTLCDINKPVNNELEETLQHLSKKYHLALASGKPFGYIAGFVRQLGLENCIVIGENGGTIMYSATFPPKDYYKIDVSDEIEKFFYKIKQEFKLKFGNKIWFQPNEVNLTVFPIDINDIELIHSFAQDFEREDINTYYHKDSVDFTPKGFNKGTAVDILLKKFNIDKDNLYIFGDGSNDIPMLKKTNNAYLVNSNLKNIHYKQHFKSYFELNEFLKTF